MQIKRDCKKQVQKVIAKKWFESNIKSDCKVTEWWQSNIESEVFDFKVTSKVVAKYLWKWLQSDFKSDCKVTLEVIAKWL